MSQLWQSAPMELIPLFSYLLLLSAHHAAAAASYYIDCGTGSTTTDNNTIFTGDSALPTGVKLHSGSSTTTSSASNSDQTIYSTARAFSSAASYEFDTSDPGTYILRLHFLAFSSDLASAQFNVSANTHLLLSNLSVPRNSSSAVSKEFLIPIQTGDGTLRVYFVPTGSPQLAFVNAIEVIPAPLNLTDGLIVTPETGYNGSFADFGSQVLTPLYRINVGGISNISSVNDGLRRVWQVDNPYLINGGISTTKNSQVVNYQGGGNATTDTAPRLVYNSARGWDPESNATSTTHNATWGFKVSKSSLCFVRVHFCDIFSQANGQIATFHLNLYTNFVWNVSAFTITNQNAAPFCLDFVVQSDGLGFVNLTIGSIKDIGGAFLNGLEIMEFVNGSVNEPNIPGKGQRHLVLIACVAAAAGLALICGVAAGFVWLRKRQRAKPVVVEEFDWPIAALNGGEAGISSDSKTTSDKSASRSSLASLPSLNLRIPIRVIQQVTNNFDDALVVGQGGFGKVYKGTRKNGQKVAVKRSDERHGQGISEFQTEITVLSRIRHRHLVSLIGYCDEGGEMILVYEFMDKGTLRDHLYPSSSHKDGASEPNTFRRLSWKQRLDICIGAAKGLHYLHTGSTGGIIHRDVKSTNILLDENFLAKVADFGLSRTGALEQDTHVSTVVKGTFGYLDPEYYQCMQLTEKSDVYSFGVLLLEVLCARLVLDPSLPRDQVNLADWAMSCKERGELEAIIDPSLAGQINPNSLNKFVETAEKCLREAGADRPPMSDVLWDLEYTLQLHNFGGQAAGFGDTSTTDASFNLPMLAVPGFSSTGFSIMEEAGFSMDDDISGLRGDSEVSMGHSKLDDSMSFPN